MNALNSDTTLGKTLSLRPEWRPQVRSQRSVDLFGYKDNSSSHEMSARSPKTSSLEPLDWPAWPQLARASWPKPRALVTLLLCANFSAPFGRSSRSRSRTRSRTRTRTRNRQPSNRPIVGSNSTHSIRSRHLRSTPISSRAASQLSSAQQLNCITFCRLAS